MSDRITLDTFKALAGLPLPDDVHTWTWERAARHSLRKWELISELYDADRFDDEICSHIRLNYTYSGSCALCQRSRDEEGKIDCSVCPLDLCGFGCNRSGSEWDQARWYLSYRPIIYALRQAVIEARKLDNPELAPTTPSVTELLTKEGAD